MDVATLPGLPPFVKGRAHLAKIVKAGVQQEQRDPAFDRVVALATRVLDAPIAMVTFLDARLVQGQDGRRRHLAAPK